MNLVPSPSKDPHTNQPSPKLPNLVADIIAECGSYTLVKLLLSRKRTYCSISDSKFLTGL